MLRIEERNAAALQNPPANTKILFNDSADDLVKLKDSAGVVETLATTEGIAAAEPKVYVALLTQTGTDVPVATILKNTLGGVPVWSYNNVGRYEVMLTDIFVDGKTISSVYNIYSNDDFDLDSFGQTFNQDNSVIEVRTTDNGTRANDHDFLIKIEVYP